MSRYRKVQVSTHTDEKFLKLSPIRPSGQSLWIYLLTGRHTTPIPGLSAAGLFTLAEHLKWSLKDVKRHWAEIEQQGMGKADWAAPCIWLPRAMYHNEPENPNVLQSWGQYVGDIPACPLRVEAICGLGTYAKGKSEAFLEAFRKGFQRYFDEGLLGTFAVSFTETGTGTGTGLPPVAPQGGRHRRVSKLAIPSRGVTGPCPKCGEGDDGQCAVLNDCRERQRIQERAKVSA